MPLKFPKHKDLAHKQQLNKLFELTKTFKSRPKLRKNSYFSSDTQGFFEFCAIWQKYLIFKAYLSNYGTSAPEWFESAPLPRWNRYVCTRLLVLRERSSYRYFTCLRKYLSYVPVQSNEIWVGPFFASTHGTYPGRNEGSNSFAHNFAFRNAH